MDIVNVTIPIVPSDNVLVAVRCGNRTYTVNCFAKPTGKIYVGSVLFVSEVRADGPCAFLEEDVPSFQVEVADLQAAIALVRGWHEERIGA